MASSTTFPVELWAHLSSFSAVMGKKPVGEEDDWLSILFLLLRPSCAPKILVSSRKKIRWKKKALDEVHLWRSIWAYPKGQRRGCSAAALLLLARALHAAHRATANGEDRPFNRAPSQLRARLGL